MEAPLPCECHSSLFLADAVTRRQIAPPEDLPGEAVLVVDPCDKVCCHCALPRPDVVIDIAEDGLQDQSEGGGDRIHLPGNRIKSGCQWHTYIEGGNTKTERSH